MLQLPKNWNKHKKRHRRVWSALEKLPLHRWNEHNNLGRLEQNARNKLRRGPLETNFDESLSDIWTLQRRRSWACIKIKPLSKSELPN